MTNAVRRVRISGTGSFLPNDPIPNDRLDEILGPLTEAPPRVQKFLVNMGARMLADGGIECRHLAIDPETHELTHTVASMAEPAARAALEHAGRKTSDVQLLLLGCPNYDYSTPPTSTILQERLGIECCAEMEIHSNCSGVGKCVQIAFDAIRLGRYDNALVTYAQHSSVYLRSSYYNQAKMTKTQAALRYILADGSGALFLEAVDADAEDVRGEILGTYLESVGGNRKAGMTAGAGVADLLLPDQPVLSMYERGSHHLDQDFTAVNRDACPLLLEAALRMLDSAGVSSRDIDHFVWSIPHAQLYENNCESFTKRLGVPIERMKFRAQKTGYVGGASILVHFDEMVRTGEIKPGQLVSMISVESSKWMSAGFITRW